MLSPCIAQVCQNGVNMVCRDNTDGLRLHRLQRYQRRGEDRRVLNDNDVAADQTFTGNDCTDCGGRSAVASTATAASTMLAPPTPPVRATESRTARRHGTSARPRKRCWFRRMHKRNAIRRWCRLDSEFLDVPTRLETARRSATDGICHLDGHSQDLSGT